MEKIYRRMRTKEIKIKPICSNQKQNKILKKGEKYLKEDF